MVYSLPNDIYDNDYNNDDNIDNLRIKLYSTHYPSINDNKVMNDQSTFLLLSYPFVITIHYSFMNMIVFITLACVN